MPMSDFLFIEHINKTYNGVRALIDLSLNIRAGEIHCIVGENGCGKSTLMKIISGVIQSDPGAETRIQINGQGFLHFRPADSIREGIQVIYQDLSLFPELSVGENLYINTRIEEKKRFISWKKINEIAKTALTNVGLDIDPHTPVKDLSVAQQQLVAIARVFTHKLKLLIMDEPTASLGKKDVDHLIELIGQLKKRGISILFVGHKLDEVFVIADRISVMRDGRLLSTTENVKSLNEKELITLMTGQEYSYATYNQKIVEKKTALLELKYFTREPYFRNINLSLYPGEILGIIGPVGAGRTELASTVFGLDKSDSGDIFINGKKVTINCVRDAIEQGIVLVPENRLVEGLFMKKNIQDNINVTMLKTLKSGILLSSKKMKKNSSDWIDNLKIKTPDQTNPANSLSGGNQQRIVLAKWISTSPRILILDGPTIGIDIGAKSEIHLLIRRLAEEQNIGIIMITDETAEAVQNASRILVMKKGTFVYEASGSGITEKHIKEELMA
jgi:simple sugar transport system ATP-binding protein